MGRGDVLPAIVSSHKFNGRYVGTIPHKVAAREAVYAAAA